MYVNVISYACLYPNAGLVIYVGKRSPGGFMIYRASYLGHSMNVPHVWKQFCVHSVVFCPELYMIMVLANEKRRYMK